MKASWSDQSRPIATLQELRSLVEELRALSFPTMVFFEHDSGRTLVVGLGHDLSVLTFVEADGASFHSRGDTSESGFLLFDCRDERQEFYREMAVPESEAIKAATAFFPAGLRPDNIDWEADW